VNIEAVSSAESIFPEEAARKAAEIGMIFPD
jgi:hypothetical protein